MCETCRRAYGVAGRAADSPWGAPAVSHGRPVAPAPSPDNPAWGAPAALGLLLASLASLFAAALCAPVVYLLYLGLSGAAIPFEVLDKATRGEVTADLVVPTVLFQGVGHVLTLAIAWAVVTDGGRRGFFESVGWRWAERVRLPHVVGIAVALQVFTILFSLVVRSPEDMPFTQLLESSPLAKIAVGVLAVVTAPLIEEVVFRGVLYPALARPLGRAAAVVIVSAIFLYIHSAQYAGAVAVMVPLGLLSVTLTALRAYTGSLLPSFVLHTLFNGITVAFMLLEAARP